MAYCEKCGTKGFTPYQMLVDPSANIFVGPCCADNTAIAGVRVAAKPPPAEDLEYGVQISNKVGVSIYLNYNGLAISYDRSPAEIKHWAIKNGLMEQKAK